MIVNVITNKNWSAINRQCRKDVSLNFVPYNDDENLYLNPFSDCLAQTKAKLFSLVDFNIL